MVRSEDGRDNVAIEVNLQLIILPRLDVVLKGEARVEIN